MEIIRDDHRTSTAEGGAQSGPAKQSGPGKKGSRVQTAVVQILRTADALRRRLGSVVEGHGVTLQQYNVLRILRGSHPEPLQTLEVAERMIEQQPGITRLLDRLEAEGLVRRQRCSQDRRRVHAWITENGLALLADMDAPVEDADAATLAELDEAEIAEMVRLLEEVERRASREDS